MTMTTVIRFTLLLLLPFSMFAQTSGSNRMMTTEQDTSKHRSFEIGFGIGGMNYQGDIIPNKFSMKNAKLGYTIFGRYNLSEKFALRLGYVGGSTGDDDSNYPSRGTRGYAFAGKINEVHLVGEWSPTAATATRNEDGTYEIRKQFTPYVFAGFALGGSSAATKIKTATATDETGAATTFWSVPLGVGFRYPISEKAKIGIELGMRYSGSDYLDGFSQRANPKNKDTYTFGAIKASFALNSRSKDTTNR
jgi:opacity protein-like surface antigen